MWIYHGNLYCRFKNIGPAPYSQQSVTSAPWTGEGGGLSDGVAAPGSPSPAGISHLRRFTPAWVPCGRHSWPRSRLGMREPFFWIWARLWVTNQTQRLRVSTGVFSSVSTVHYRGWMCQIDIRTYCGVGNSICILLYSSWRVNLWHERFDLLSLSSMCLCILKTVSCSEGFEWKIQPEASSAALTYF